MKITTRFLYINVLLLALALAVATLFFLAEVYSAAQKTALEEQDQHLKTFWKLLSSKGQGVRIVAGKMLVGNFVVNDSSDLPDHIQDIFDCTATIFLGDIRISTNVLLPDGTRAIGTKLEGPAYDAIFKQGKSYRGETLILGVPYLTAYDPIKDV